MQRLIQKIIIAATVLFLVLGVLGASRNPGDEKPMIDKLLPEKVAGWAALGKGRTYTRDTLFHYMYGAGEVYLSFDFQRLLVKEYVSASAPPIVAEIYQMSSSRDAYGIFSHDAVGEELDIGQGALFGLGLLRFWKDRVFVRVLANTETKETKAAVMAVGRKIAEAIPKVGEKPYLLSCVPSTGLLKGPVPYFHKQISLDLQYYLADSNILNLSEKTKVVLARYKTNDNKVRLLLCRYPDPKEAKAAFDKFSKAYFSDKMVEKAPMRIEKIGKGEFVSARAMEKTLILVLGAGDRRTCEELIEAAEKKIKEVF